MYKLLVVLVLSIIVIFSGCRVDYSSKPIDEKQEEQEKTKECKQSKINRDNFKLFAESQSKINKQFVESVISYSEINDRLISLMDKVITKQKEIIKIQQEHAKILKKILDNKEKEKKESEKWENFGT